MSLNENAEFNRLADARLTTCNISDSLDKFGYREQVAFNRLVSLRPKDRVMGRARTVKFEDDSECDSNNPYDDMIAFIDSTQPGKIIEFPTERRNTTAFWGRWFGPAQ